MGCAPSTALISGVSGAGPSADPLEPFVFNFETVDATPVIIAWAQLPVDGAGVVYEGRGQAVQSNGANGQYAFIGGQAAAEAGVVGFVNPIIGGAGYIPPGPPWATPGAPGYTMFLAQIAGTSLQLNVAGLAATVVRWSGFIIRSFVGGATP